MERKPAFEVAEHPGIGDGQRRQVDGDPRRQLARRRRRGSGIAEQRDHSLQHPTVQLADQSVALGRGQEAPGRHETPVGLVVEAHERLVV